MTHRSPLLAVLTAACFFATPAAVAQVDDMRTLTPVKVRELIMNMTEKTRPGGRLNDQQVIDYLNAHLADDGTFTSNMTYKIAGYDEQVQQVAVDKEQFIQNVLSGRADIQDYSSDVKVTDVEVSKDKQSAGLKTITREKGRMPVGDGKYMPFTGQSECLQQIRMMGNIPQIAGASCTSRIEVK